MLQDLKRIAFVVLVLVGTALFLALFGQDLARIHL